MKPRRTHTKSRKGCGACKRRRVKCDEQGPPCSNCIKRSIECVYIPVAAAHVAQQFPETDASTTSTETRSPAPDQQPLDGAVGGTEPAQRGHIWMRELELMHVYSTQSCQSLARIDAEEVLAVWRDFIPQESMRHEFLLNGLFTFTSLHLKFLRPAEAAKHFASALEYQDVGFQQFRATLLNINQQNCHAAFAFAILTMINAMAMSAVPSEVDAKNPIERILDGYKMLKGLGSMVRLYDEWISSGPLAGLLGSLTLADPSTLDQGTKAAFSMLRRLNDEFSVSTAKHAYQVTIDSLEGLFAAPPSTLDRGSVLAWLLMSGTQYPDLLGNSEPLAQAILAYFAVQVVKSMNWWWSKGSGERIVRELADSLLRFGPPWDEPAQWALEQIQRSSGPRTSVGV